MISLTFLDRIKSLSFKLSLPYLLTAPLIFVALLLTCHFHFRHMHNVEIENEFSHIASTLKITQEIDPSRQSLSAVIKVMALRKHIEHLLIADLNSLRVIADSHSDHDGELLQDSLTTITWDFIQDYLSSNNRNTITMEVDHFRYQISPFDRVVINGGGVSNLLLVVFDQTEMIKEERQWLWEFGRALGIGLLFLGIINHFLLRRILIDPMQKMTNIIEEQQDSDDVLFLPELGIDELGILSRSYNELARERARERRKLEEARRYVEGITHQVPVLLAYIDRNFYYRFVNQGYTRWFGLAYKDIINKPVSDLIGIEPFRKIKKYMVTALDGGTAHYEYEAFHIELGMRDVQISYRPDVSLEGEVRGFFTCVEDITERKEIEKTLERHAISLEQQVAERTRDLELAKIQAEEANLGKTNFLSNMSHELRTPMHGIISFARLGLSRCNSASAEKIESYFRNIQISGDRLLNLLNDLLDLSRIEAGHVEHKPQNNDIHALLLQCRKELGAKLEEREVTLIITGPKTPIIAYFDYHRICQVMINLIANAIKFSSIKSTITVHASMVKEQLQVQVEDEGIGIEKVDYELIFSKFTQARKSGSGPGTGMGSTGLGLAICREIIHAHEGEIWVESKLNKGSSFYFRIPLNPKK